MSFASRTACTPYALSILFKEPYDRTCQRIQSAGGDYRSVATGILHGILQDSLGIQKFDYFQNDKPTFRAWRIIRKDLGS